MAAPRRTDAFPSHFESLSVGFLCMRSTQELEKELNAVLETLLESTYQRQLINMTIHHPQCAKYPPSKQYRRKFMKIVIAELEASGAEIIDELYEAYTDLFSSGPEEDEEYCFKTYTLPNGDLVTLEESVNLISKGTTGLQTWQAAMCLAEYLLDNKNVINNRCVIELGCGLGFTGIVACSALQPARYVFTDCHHEVLKRLRANLQINKLLYDEDAGRNFQDAKGIKNCAASEESRIGKLSESNGANAVDVRQLDWDDISRDHLEDSLQCDVVLAADVVYDPSIIPSLVKVLTFLLSDGAVAYLASTLRNEDTYAAFVAAINSSGLHYEKVEQPRTAYFFYTGNQSVPNEILRISAVK